METSESSSNSSNPRIWLASSSNISVRYLNARSLSNKIRNFQGLIYSSNFNIVGVTETWLTTDITNKEILPKGFNIYRKDRQSRGGGILLAISNTFSSTSLDVPSEIEAVSIRVSLTSPIVFCVIYIAPQSSSDCYKTCFDYIASLANSFLVIIIGVTLTYQISIGPLYLPLLPFPTSLWPYF